MKRFDLRQNPINGQFYMAESPTGEYVEYAALSHAAGQEAVDCVRSSELWYAIDEAKNPADFLARAIAILQRSNMAMVDNTAVLEPAVARSEGEGE